MKTILRPVRQTIPLAVFAVILTSCVDVAYEPPNLDAPTRFVAATKNENAAPVPTEWWRAFKDPRLDQLIQAGMAQNLDVRQAVERIEEAQANVGVANAGLFPTIAGGGGLRRGDTDGDGTYSKGTSTLTASWMVDLFGKQRASKRAAEAKLDAAYLTADVARLTILSAIASTYIDLRYYQASIALTKRSIEGRKKSLELTQMRKEAGDATQLEVVQSEQLVAKAEAGLPELEVNFESAVDRLATLTGEPVATIRPRLQRGAPQPEARFRVSVGVPAEVLRNRPDVRVAERNLAAAAQSVGIAKASLYPTLELSGYLTPTYVVDVGHVQIWNAAAEAALTVFDGGKRQAALSAAQSQMKQARLAWEAAVLDAVEEVEKALAAYNRDDRNIAAQEKLVSTSRRVLELGRDSYRLGAETFINILDAERSYLEAEQSLAQAIRQQASNYVVLCVAAVGSVGQPEKNSKQKPSS